MRTWDLMLPRPSRVLVTNPDRQLPCHFSKTVLRIPSTRTHPEKSTYDSDMYNRAFPVGNALFFFAGDMMSLFRLPRGKLSLAFLAVPAGKDGRVERPCQTFDGFIGIGGSVCGLFLFVQTHAPLIVPPWQIRARKSKFQFLSGARARMLSALHLRLVAR